MTSRSQLDDALGWGTTSSLDLDRLSTAQALPVEAGGGQVDHIRWRARKRGRPPGPAGRASGLRLVGVGRSNAGIGARLFIGARTVEWHFHQVSAKLGVTSRGGLKRGSPVSGKLAY